jgi:uncharacterized protein involved in outer membrane biogenesis
MKWLRRLGWLVLAVAVLMGASWLALPGVLKSQGEQRLSTLLGRAVSIGQVELKPWSLELTVRQFQIAGLANSPKPLLRAERLYVNADARSLFRLAPVVEALEIDAPQIHLTRTAQGRYDIDDVLARLQPKTKEAPPSEPPQFALYNMQLKDGVLTLDDRAIAGRIHELKALQVSLPFLSNLPAEVDVKVTPRLAFKLNDAAFDSGAQATPFAQNRAADLKLTFTDVDLAPYLGYVPASVPVRLTRGSVSADVAVKFEMPAGAQPRVSLQGNVGAKGVEVHDPKDAPLLSWRSFKLALKDVQPFKQSLQFGDVVFDGLQLHASRDAKGRLNVQQWSPATVPADTKAVGSTQAPWSVQLDSFALNNAQVHWDDAQARPAAAYVLNSVNLKTGPLAWPIKTDAEVQVNAALTSSGAGEKSPAAEFGRVTLSALGSDQKAQIKLQLEALTLQALRPYVAAHLVPSLSGTLAAQAQVDWAAGQGGQPSQVKLAVSQATLDGLRLGEAGGVKSSPSKKNQPSSAAASAGLASLAKLEIADAQIDLNAQAVTIGSVKLTQPQVSVARDAQGAWNVEQWAVAQPAQAAAKTSATSPAKSPTSAAPPWKIQLRDFALTGGRVRFSDAQTRPGAVANVEANVGAKPSSAVRAVASEDLPAVPVQVDFNAIKVALQNLSLQGGKTATAAKLQVSANVTPMGGAQTSGTSTDTRRAGSVEWRGQLGLQPLAAAGNLRLSRFPVQAFEPYFGDALNVSLLRAEAGYQGEVAVREEATAAGKAKGLRIALGGDVLLADLLVHTKPTADTRAGRSSTDELLSWQSLTLKGLKLATAPGAPPNIEIQEAALSDFYSRLVITEEGRFNLQDAAAPTSSETASSDAAAPAEVKPAAPTAAASVASSASSVVASTEPPAFNLVIHSTRLNNGRVDFTDRFIRPNYSANLTELNGGLGEFRTGTRDMATLELRGKAAGTALLDIKGQINPTAKPLALDLRARATDLELAPFSPYAGKYAGYAIERGKLSVDVSYKIDAAGNLDAKNQVTLNQLTFGDKIESASATKLPVLLAVALLKDRNGVIDINLPVSGSLNNPQFSVFGIVLKVIGNLLVKAFTSPFALLAGGGGADDLSLVGFSAGTANVSEEGRGTLTKVAKALSEKPGLKMTVTGAADPTSEREAYVQTLLDQRLLAERKRELVRAGAAPEAPVVMASDDRARVLKEIYKQTDIPTKPRNAIGIARDVSGPEMETLLKTRIVVSAEAMRELALQRGLAVRDALIAQGLPSERLFLAAPKLRASGEDDAAWSPRVQLALTAN